MECKKALEVSGGDIEKAIIYLREQGILKAAQKVHRETKEGQVFASISADRRRGAMVELNSETDFVARTDEFQQLGELVARHLGAVPAAPASREALLEQPDPDASGQTIGDRIKGFIARCGENTTVGRFVQVALEEGSSGLVESYVHLGGKLGVLVEIRCGDQTSAAREETRQLARELAMQVAASSPLSVARQGLSGEILERERDIYRAQAQASGKPPAVVQRIIDGKLEKFYSEACLLEQPYIKDPDRTVTDLMREYARKLGEITVHRFVRYRLGE
jgi:elongation factor Ts